MRAVGPAHGAANGNQGVENVRAVLKRKRQHDATITLTGDWSRPVANKYERT